MPKVLSEEEIACFRNRMCDHALASFAKSGVEGISLRGLAADLRCSRTTPYRYFKNKADILAALRQREFARIADTLENALSKEPTLSKQLSALCHAYFEFALAFPDSYRVMYSVSQPDLSKYTDLENEILRSSMPMRQVVKSAISAGILKGDPVEICYVIWAGLHGLISLHLSHMLGEQRDVAQLATVMIDALLRSVSDEPTSSESNK
ncbi:hypothetical protein FX988_00617 [Paraglaciecola mesophila]|uniref:HTH tetR-type domain-containing protein n=1 Tax=Paraglaciecola mesophila TaxID=197222 RepID=A0A857JEG1_9ALTE|nr:TetR/AcrR family transcriptional regulator [Paraglaciecola mesophila]QHJ10405.1 hypothetical protein FX988_00617 [Paraglaciecola mesophila]